MKDQTGVVHFGARMLTVNMGHVYRAYKNLAAFAKGTDAPVAAYYDDGYLWLISTNYAARIGATPV
jgi:hypothetical protein